MKRIVLFSLLAIFASMAFANSFFSGATGFRVDSRFYDRTKEKTDTQLNISSFLAGQITFSENFFFRHEFSLAVKDLFSESFFSQTDAMFKIDELSLIYRARQPKFTNYLSAYAGNYEPIGSDIFLQRYLGNEPIASKLTDSWLGTGNSVVNPVFSFGISDVITFTNKPMALGVSFLGSRETDNGGTYALSGNVRYALSLTYLTFDASVGFGAPIEKNKDEIKFTKPFMRMGTTILIGNNYMPLSLFMQAGTSHLNFDNKKSTKNKENFYFILEPRINVGNNHINISFYDFPQRTLPLIYSVSDSLGVNFLYYNDYVYIKGKRFTFGGNTSISFPGTNLLTITGKDGIIKNGISWKVAPFMATNFMSGEVKLEIEFEPMKINYENQKLAASARNAADMFRVSVGYKGRL